MEIRFYSLLGFRLESAEKLLAMMFKSSCFKRVPTLLPLVDTVRRCWDTGEYKE